MMTPFRSLPDEGITRIMESLPVAVIATDQQGTIKMINRAAEEFFGYPKMELEGQSVEVLLPESLRAAHPKMRENYCHAPQTRPMGSGRDLYGRRKDGSQFPIEIGLSSFPTEEGMMIICTIVDISVRKALEASLVESKEALEASNAELQQFAYIASHDLQAPLRTISGFMQLLSSEYGAQFDERAQRWIERASSGAIKMQELIQDLLSFAQVESRARPFIPVDMEEIMAEVRDILESSIEDTKAEISHSPLPVVQGDPLQLSQLLRNLVGNAIKYHSKASPKVHVSATRKDQEWIFSVQDNGIGIDPKHQEKVFEIFRRLHSERAYPGNGIGLAICKRILQRHLGAIWLESELGNGCTFYFTLPAES